jgi:hypothetical protein
VYLDGVGKAGSGKHLYDALKGRVNVIGVAKRPFKNISHFFAVYRGGSDTPVYVTSDGIEIDIAKKLVKIGSFDVDNLWRIPYLKTLLRRARIDAPGVLRVTAPRCVKDGGLGGMRFAYRDFLAGGTLGQGEIRLFMSASGQPRGAVAS